MDSKLLLIGIALLGILLVGVLVQRDDWDVAVAPSDMAEAQLVDGARFVLERAGVRILEEEYTIFFHPVEGYMLLSQSELTVGDETIALAQQAQYDREFRPFQYQLAADTPSGAQIISAQMGVTGFAMEVRSGLERQSAEIVDASNLALLDNNVIGHYVILLAAIRAGALTSPFTAAIPQALLSLPGKIEGPARIGFHSGDAAYEGERYDVRLGDTSIVLIEYDGRLAGILNRAQATAGYDVGRFPDGLTLDAQEEEAGLPAGMTEREIAFASDGLTLMGTLALPSEGERPFPAVLFLHGSGPVDRDGNAAGMQMDAYRQLAHALAQDGIASLRFDKRGVGESEGVSSSASRSDLLDDLRAAVEALRSHPNIDPDRIILIGHSEGAYLAPILAVEDETVAGIILIAGAARSLDLITRWQVETLLRQRGVEGATLEAALAQQDQYIAFVEASEGSWADYTVEQMQEEMPWLTDEAATQLAATPLALSWLREHYLDEPAMTLRNVICPVLILSGEKDAQVPVSEGLEIERILEEAGNDDVSVSILGDLNHLLRRHPEEPNLVYRHLDEPVDPRVVEVVTEWAIERLAR